MSRKLQVEIVGDSRSLQRAFGSAGKSADGFGSKIGRAGKVIGAAAVGVGAAITGGFIYSLKRGFDELSESQKVSAQTAAAIKSTGAAANITAKQVESLASALSRKSGIDDEEIQASENLLLTFKNVRNELGKGNDVFNQATKAALDLSVAGFGSLESTSKMLGKALNDPIKGMTAMGRAGVTFSEDQKKAIKALVESGKALEAQKLILKEVESQVGGSAKAYGETLPGQLSKLRNSFDEVAGQLAVKFLPALISAVDWVNANWPTISRVIDAVGTAVIGTFQVIGAVIRWLQQQWERHGETVSRVWRTIQTSVSQTIAWFKTNVVPAIQNIVAAAQALWDRFGNAITTITKTTFGAILVVVRTMLQNVKSAIEIITAIIRGDWGKAWNELKAIVGRSLAAVWTLMKAAVSNALTAARAIGAAIIDGIVAGLVGIGNEISTMLQRGWDVLRSAATHAGQLAVEIGKAIVSGILSGLGGLLSSLKDKMTGAISGAFGAVKGALGIRSPSKRAADEIGKPIADGILLGFLNGSATLPSSMSERLRAALEAAKTLVDAQRGRMASAFQQLASDALRAFDAATDAGLAKIQGKLAARLAAIDAQLSRALAGIESRRGKLTPAEAALANMDAAEAKRQRDSELAAAQQGLADAQAGGDPAEILAAQERLRQAQLAIDRAALEKLAEQQRAAADKLAAQQTAAAEAAAAKKRKTAETEFGRRALEYQAERDLRRRHLEQYLAMVEAQLEKEPKKWGQRHAEIMRKFKKEFGPDFETAGKNLGSAFARGLEESMNQMEGAAIKLARLIAKYLKTNSPTEKGPLSTLDRWWQGFVPALVKGFDTRGLQGFLSGATGMGVPTVSPARASAGGFAGGGGQVVNVYVSGSVISERDLARTVRDHLVGIGRSSGGGVFAGQA